MEFRTGRTIRWVVGLAVVVLAAVLGFGLSRFAGEVESGRADAAAVHKPGARIKVIASPGMEETIASKNAVAENTPAGQLVLAARGGDATRVRELLAEGIPPDAEESMHGHRALHQAAKSGQVEVVEMLLAAGAEPNGLDGSGMSPLMRASYAAVLPVGKHLLAAGADVNARSDPHGETALGQLAAGSFMRWFRGEAGGTASNQRAAELDSEESRWPYLLARLLQVHVEALVLGGGAIPLGEAVAAEAGEVHQVDVLHVRPLAQLRHQRPERGRFEGGSGVVVHRSTPGKRGRSVF